jgi:alpha-L-rhamnosidase
MKEPGFRKIIFRPNFVKDLDHARATYQSIQGEIKASWKQTSTGTFEYQVTVPPNTTAELVLPEGTQKLVAGDHTFTVNL